MIKIKEGFQGEQSVVLPPLLVELEERDELCKSLFITDIGYYPKAEHHYRQRATGIDQYVLIYCVDGCGFYVVDGSRHEVGKNQFFVLPAGRPHEYGATEGQSWTIYWLHFRGEHAHIYAEGADIPQDIDVRMHSRISDRIGLFDEILNTLHNGEGVEDLRYASSLLHYFLASMRYLKQFRRANHTSEPSPTPIDIVEQAIHYMRENIEQHVAIDDVLHYVGYSQSHFSTLFKRKTGLSPLSYLKRLKVEHACHLLKTTDLRVNQICYKVGFDDPLYFSRLFSKVMGMSPTRFKENNDRSCPTP